jgi:hypothetical protein
LNADISLDEFSDNAKFKYSPMKNPNHTEIARDLKFKTSSNSVNPKNLAEAAVSRG